MKFIPRFLETYEYSSIEEFIYSMVPSFKYKLQGLTLTLSFLAAGIDHLFGIGPALAIAMVVAIIVETWSGIKASRKNGKKFSSFRFSRCIIKVFIWFSLLYIIHAFESDFSEKPGIMADAAQLFFQFIFIMVLTYFMIEYVTSILENLGTISGKNKTALIEVIQNSWKQFIQSFKFGKQNENDRNQA